MKNKFFRKMLNWSMLLLAATLIFSSCNDDDDETPPVIIEDGVYVKGAGTALTEYDANGLMAVTKNEVGQVDRTSLKELYVAVKAGNEGFNIIVVTGGTPTVYGPDAGFGDVTNPTNDEPKDAIIQRGPYVDIQKSINPFTVPHDGLYHVVIDTESGIATVTAAHWGIIGGATPLGWGGSVVMDEPAFDLNKMTFSSTDLELRGGDWKFRYSSGWKIEIDTVSDPQVKVNTNLGGAVDALVPGGDNIVNSDPGLYTIELVWDLTSGISATATKTAELPKTNWTDVVLDAVGDGVSADNTNAIADPSSWGWGNKLLADAVPTIDGDVYTWTWTNVVLEADSGFKLRTEDGVAPSNGNGAGFDAGLESVDHDNSSANVNAETTGNITVTVKATYNIKMVIDAAAEDSKVITITDAS